MCCVIRIQSKLKKSSIFPSAVSGVNHTSHLTEGHYVCQGQRQAERIIKRAFNGTFWCYLKTQRKNEKDTKSVWITSGTKTFLDASAKSVIDADVWHLNQTHTKRLLKKRCVVTVVHLTQLFGAVLLRHVSIISISTNCLGIMFYVTWVIYLIFWDLFAMWCFFFVAYILGLSGQFHANVIPDEASPKVFKVFLNF